MLVLFLVVVLVAGAAAYYGKQLLAESPTEFRTVAVDRGDVVTTISATGTLEPEEVVDVGAQVAGRIVSFGPDPESPSKLIDFCSVVEEGTILAHIDQTSYKAAVAQAAAALARSEADRLQLIAKCNQAKRERERAESLVPKNAIAQTDYDLAVANHETAEANVKVGEATINQNKAALDMANTNLGYTTIKSPVKGVVISRRVNIGQTVVASLSAPSMFLIAKDLKRMQIWSSVNEADIGRIYVGMPIKFTVDAFPDEQFEGSVAQIRMDAQTTQNVVTYTVVVTTDNSSGRLLPYLTTNLQFQVDQHCDVLRVSNAALRWKPRLPAQIAPDARETASANSVGRSERRRGREAAAAEGTAEVKKKGKTDKRQEHGTLWIKDGEFVRPVEVQVGLTDSDGSVTEVSGQEVKEGMEVIVGERRGADVAGDKTTNPFLPDIRRGQGRGR